MDSDRQTKLEQLLSTVSSAETQAMELDSQLHQQARDLRYQVHRTLHDEIDTGRRYL